MFILVTLKFRKILIWSVALLPFTYFLYSYTIDGALFSINFKLNDPLVSRSIFYRLDAITNFNFNIFGKGLFTSEIKNEGINLIGKFSQIGLIGIFFHFVPLIGFSYSRSVFGCNVQMV